MDEKLSFDELALIILGDNGNKFAQMKYEEQEKAIQDYEDFIAEAKASAKPRIVKK